MSDLNETAAYRAGAMPPFSVTHIESEICGGDRDRWFVMGTVNGDPRNGCGPVAICEWEPSAHEIADLLNRRYAPAAPERKSLLGRLRALVRRLLKVTTPAHNPAEVPAEVPGQPGEPA